MANKTTNFGLTKPEATDFYNVNVHNDNMDKIDGELSKYSLKTLTDVRKGFGIAVGAETIGAISAVLPEFSTLTLTVDSTYNAEIRPNNSTSGLLRVTKGVRPKEVVFEFWTFVGTTTGHYIGVSNNITEWSGWKEIPSVQDVPTITYGTTDLTEGVSALSTGTLHLVYERGGTV